MPNLLYLFCKVRGPKVISRFLPQEVTYLTQVLSRLDTPAILWQKAYALLLWLSVLVLAPFELESFEKNTKETLYSVGCKWLRVPGKERDAASILLARLLTRIDTRKEYLTTFMGTATELWHTFDIYHKMGVLKTVSVMCNLLEPHAIFVYLENFIEARLFQDINAPASYDKLVSKCLGRIGVVYVVYDLANESVLEQILDSLLNRLSASDTVVRLAASKAIANIAHVLPTEMQSDIVDMVFSIILDDCPESPGDPQTLRYLDRYNRISVNHWHGALLLIAELFQRKMPLARKYADLLTIIAATLTFEQRKLTYAVGANVRDASCYVCWAMFRACTDIPHAIFEQLMAALTATSCFDREINIRRAASAAIQEGVGRHPDEAKGKGIQVIQALDFFKLGNRELAYLTVAPMLYELGYSGLVKHVCVNGVVSWDESLARLAAKALGVFASKSEQVRASILGYLRRFISDRYVSYLDNLIYALAEVYLATEVDEFAVSILNLESVQTFTTDDRPLAEAYTHFLRAYIPATGPDPLISTHLEIVMTKQWDSVLPDLEKIAQNLTVPQQQALPLPAWLQEVQNGNTSFLKFLCEVDMRIPNLPEILDHLILNQQQPMSVRCAAVRGLGTVLQKEPFLVTSERLELLLNCLENYKVDHQGDVGSWMRKDAIQVWSLLADADSSKFSVSAEIWRTSEKKQEQKLVRCAVELLDTLREDAVKALVSGQSPVSEFFQETDLLTVMNTDFSQYFSKVMPILDLEKTSQVTAEFATEFMRGLVYTSGARYASPNIIKLAFSALSIYLTTEDEEWAVVHWKRIMALASIKKEKTRIAEGAIGVLSMLLEAGVQVPTGLT